ncbi:MAG TPA: hypothetical protein P5531_01535 [Bacteroidales bacterium]|nr:hypothetical protein [Bacteroidales bacterium]HSA42337.1 hypothetical protein [Bacteroidales bacterium]
MPPPTIARVKIHVAWPLRIPGFDAYCFYVHKYFNTEDSRWSVTEGYSGLAVCANELSRNEAIESAVNRLQHTGPDGFRSIIHDAYSIYGYINNHRLIVVNSMFSEVDVDNISSLSLEKIRQLMSRPFPG